MLDSTDHGELLRGIQDGMTIELGTRRSEALNDSEPTDFYSLGVQCGRGAHCISDGLKAYAEYCKAQRAQQILEMRQRMERALQDYRACRRTLKSWGEL